MQMLSEVGINRHIYPIIQKRGRVFEGDYVKMKGDEIVFRATEDSRWNLRCYKFMDYIASKIRNKFEDYNHKQSPGGFIKNLSDPRLEIYSLLMRPDLIYSIKNGVNNPTGQNGHLATPYVYFPKLNIKSIAKDLKWMKSDVIKIIKMISSYKFKTKYHFLTALTYGSKVNKSYKHSYNNFSDDYEPVFNVEFSEDESECIIKFNTGFGICFLHNIYVGGYDLFDEKLYSLTESAQIIYRKRFFTYSKILQATLEKGYVMDILGLHNTHKTQEQSLFEKIINEIIEKTEVELLDRLCSNRFVLSKGRPKKKKYYRMDLDNNKYEITKEEHERDMEFFDQFKDMRF